MQRAQHWGSAEGQEQHQKHQTRSFWGAGRKPMAGPLITDFHLSAPVAKTHRLWTIRLRVSQPPRVGRLCRWVAPLRSCARPCCPVRRWSAARPLRCAARPVTADPRSLAPARPLRERRPGPSACRPCGSLAAPLARSAELRRCRRPRPRPVDGLARASRLRTRARPRPCWRPGYRKFGRGSSWRRRSSRRSATWSRRCWWRRAMCSQCAAL